MSDVRDKVERVVRQVVYETMAAGDVDIHRLPERVGRRPLIAANWKMNLLVADARQYAAKLDPHAETGVETLLCPALVLLPVLRGALSNDTLVSLGAQDLHPEHTGAHTGEHSAEMIKDAGASYVIVGHSERRAAGEDDELVRRKLQAALAAGLMPILCVGERFDERERGATFRVLRGQLTLALSGLGQPAPDPRDLVVAYEPIWAIGSGLVASPSQVQEALVFIRDRLGELFSHAWAERSRLLYGGSVGVGNAGDLARLPDCDGFLVGGAGLNPEALSEIIAITARSYGREKA